MTNDTKDKLNRYHYDIILIGGGMVGASAAIALSQLFFQQKTLSVNPQALSSQPQALKIAVVEAFEPNLAASPSFDQRAVALSAASVAILKSLGLWSQIAPLACGIDHIHVSNRGHFGFTRLDAKDYEVEALGHVIPLDQTGPILWQAMQQQENIELFCPYQLEKLLDDEPPNSDQKAASQTSQFRSLRIKDAEGKITQLSGKLILAADGTLSPIGKQLAMPMIQKDYGQQAIIANISTQIPHKNRAFERFTDQGPIALLPLTRNRMSLVWCVGKDQWQALMDLDDAGFLQQLQEAFGFRLGYFTKLGKRASYPLALRYAEKSYQAGVMLLGNAAHTLHPIAGQGFNLALRDVAALVDFIAASDPEGADFASEAFLQAFEQQRQADWQTTIQATDNLVRLFSNDFLPLVFARNKLLCLLDHLPPAKQILAQQAMGFAGHSARLTRGITAQAAVNQHTDSSV